MLTTAELLRVNTVPLNTMAYNIETWTGRGRVPGRRGSNIAVHARHGFIRTKQKKFNGAEVILAMWVIGADEDGLVPSNPLRRALLKANSDKLVRLFGADTQEWVQVQPDGSERRIFGEVTEPIDFFAEPGELARFPVAMGSWMAFWEDAIPIVAGFIGEGNWSVTGFAAATAPCDELTVTLNGPCTNPKIQSEDIWVQYNAVIPAGHGIVINCATWILTGTGGLVPNYAALGHGGDGRWFVLKAGIPPMPPIVVVSDTSPNPVNVTLAGRRKYLKA